MNDLLSSKLFDNNNFYSSFTKDLERAHQSIIIESPFITIRRVDELLPELTKLRKRGVSIIINTRNPNEHNPEYELQAWVAIETFQRIGIKVLYTVRHHRKLAIIDREILWEGSLNILSQGDSCEVMRRSVSPELSRDMLDFIGAVKW